MLPVLLSVLAILVVLTPQVFTVVDYLFTKLLPKTPSWVKVCLGFAWVFTALAILYVTFILTIYM